MGDGEDSFKVCTCGKRYSLGEWRQLRRCGIVDVEKTNPAPPGEPVLPPVEMRTCSACGSTISKRIPYEGGSAYPPPMPGSRE